MPDHWSCLFYLFQGSDSEDSRPMQDLPILTCVVCRKYCHPYYRKLVNHICLSHVSEVNILCQNIYVKGILFCQVVAVSEKQLDAAFCLLHVYKCIGTMC